MLNEGRTAYHKHYSKAPSKAVWDRNGRETGRREPVKRGQQRRKQESTHVLSLLRDTLPPPPDERKAVGLSLKWTTDTPQLKIM